MLRAHARGVSDERAGSARAGGARDDGALVARRPLTSTPPHPSHHMSLLQLARLYVLDAIKGYQAPGTLTALVVDETVQTALLRAVPREQLLRYVTLVELIESRRKTQPYIAAIYFVAPTALNVKCMAADALTRRYKCGHVLLAELPSLADFQELLAQQQRYFALVRHLPYALYPCEARVFVGDLATRNAMPIYYNDNCRDLVMVQIARVARTLVSAVVMAGEYPLVRYYCPPPLQRHLALRLPELIANEFQQQIDAYARANEDFPPQREGAPRAVLVITDRTLDLYAPLLHEFLYQAMLHDIVEVLEREGHYVYESENERGEKLAVTVTLDNENDTDWVALRHLHIIESSELILAKINDLIAKNPMMVDRLQATTLTDLMYIVAHLLGFDAERRQVTLHKQLIDECLDINSARKLAEYAADFEQTCAAGGTLFEGVRNRHLADDLVTLLAREDLAVNDKMRLVLIYALYRGGLVELDFRKLVKFIGLSDTHVESVTQRCFTNFEKLGFLVVKPSTKVARVDKLELHTINNEGTFNTSRFAPAIKQVLQRAAKYQLDEETFPYFRDKPLDEDVGGSEAVGGSGPSGPSGRNPRVKASWANKPLSHVGGSGGSIGRAKQRIFCFVAGGMTYSEMRSVYELTLESNGAREFYIGSESILKPRDFLIGLQNVDSAKTRTELDLYIDRQRARDRMKVPLYLLETAPPPLAPPLLLVPPQSALSANGRASSGSSHSSAPLHYQTRLSQGGESKSPEKPKKTSKLKRLFK